MRLLLGLTVGLLSILGPRAAAGWAGSPGDPGAPGARWRIRGQSWVDTTSWRSPFRGASQDQLQAQHRLTLEIYNLVEGDPQAVRFEGDLLIGADLAPPDDDLAPQPRPNRATFDLRYGALIADDLLGPIGLRAGRLQLYDPAGFDALDGGGLSLDLPHLYIEGVAGRPAHEGTWGAGPDVPSPEGLLPDPGGHLIGASARSQGIAWLDLQGAWRRRVDGDGGADQERLGAEAVVRLGPWLQLQGGGAWDVLFERWASLRGGLGGRWGDLSVQIEGRLHRPTYGARSIWSYFDPLPYRGLRLSAHHSVGPWQIRGAVDGRRYGGDDTPEADAAGAEAELIWIEATDPMGVTRLGLRLRHDRGFGGAQTVGDLSGQRPVGFELGERPLWLRGRLGWMHTAEADTLAARAPWAGATGWALAALRWPASESSAIELLAESHHSAFTPARIRLMAQLVVEDWL